MIKLITIDIDGTLLTNTRRLPKKNKEMILKAKKLGAHIALVSGRPFSGILPYVKELDLEHEGHFQFPKTDPIFLTTTLRKSSQEFFKNQKI